MQAAVNCLVKDARRKFVSASMGWRVRRSVTAVSAAQGGLAVADDEDRRAGRGGGVERGDGVDLGGGNLTHAGAA